MLWKYYIFKNPFRTGSKEYKGNYQQHSKYIFLSELSVKFSTNYFPTLLGKVVIYPDKDEWLGLYPSQHFVNHDSVIYRAKTSI